MHFLNYSELGSTNSELARLADEGAAAGTVVTARAQTAGRGQRGNSWESAPGLNVTMSVLLRPREVAPREQFAVSEAVALAVAETLDTLLPPSMTAAVKWPNDIYVGNRKICGILIENRVWPASIERSIAGIGLNVNQRRFLSDAPNPVSVWQLTGEEHDVDAVARELARRVIDNCAVCRSLHGRYMARLWRNDGALHPFREPGGDCFDARIADVALGGLLSLELAGGEVRRYAFKEIEFVL